MRVYMRTLLLLSLLSISFGDHFKGGSISWKPTNPSVITGNIPIIITERYSWTFSRYPCNETIINSFGPYNDTQNATTGTLVCISSSAVCTSSLFTTISSPLYCTDFSTKLKVSSGTYYTTQSLAVNSIIDIASRGASWMAETLANSWSLVSHIDLTPISNKINTSPVLGSLPIIQLYTNQPITAIQFIVADWDNDQIVRCRWSYQYDMDECGNACYDLPNATISTVDCSVTWKAILRSEDVAKGLTQSTYIVAITAEDFVNASSTTPLSSASHQILVYVSDKPANVCSNRPSISGFPRRNQACYATSTLSTNVFRFYGSVSSICPNDSIVDFIASSPFNIQKSVIYQVGNSTTYGVNVTWFVLSNQAGLQPFCIAAVDNNGQTSSQYCVMVAVGATNPSFRTPLFVQSTASPLGTVMSTQKRFSIQATLPLRRTTLNNTYIRIYRSGFGTASYRIDCKYSPDVYFINNTLVFYIYNTSWVLGATYYVTMTEGVATSNEYCGVESGSVGSSSFWVFTIWNPAVSSTTTVSTTTSTATTHTVTTRVMGTTTYNTLYTTTGLPAITTITTTSTTSTTSTSATTTTTTSATTTTTTTTTTTEYIPDADVMYPKDMERACLQPVTIATVIITVVMIPLRLLGLINLFVKMNSNNEKEILKARKLRRLRLQEINHEETESLV